jgi:UDP-2,3-diacylglucosamine hydrolase
MHGDTLCTDDLPYQEFRRMVRAPEWQRDFLARPLAERRTEVESCAVAAPKPCREKAPEIMDANPGAIRAALTDHGCTRLIHGHTHRPGRERIPLAAGSAQRWVMSDWDTGRGDALEISPAGQSAASTCRLDQAARQVRLQVGRTFQSDGNPQQAFADA